MPVTKTAKRALRGSLKKAGVNNAFRKSFEISLRIAKKEKSQKAVDKAGSLADKAVIRGLIHKNKASRIKSMLSKLTPTVSTKKSKKSAKK
ncbi:MAG: 30S ribosomal protein S20 [Candidatus Woesebacteria bacterium GW2011_GWA1_37_8]|uniref:Small ribosomal subunit protein bS20 n=1 Tax=Candidatus Woesebacteria bacterium GW2011_GWA1_37_8 TaxID=1618546 RepID=A0A0G0I215_9BACT|nr:MAG: 30S ribosomal protein S20 [Candidatus Woesebacteria bacterium GW2011_GWA1_37_8]